MGVIWTVIGIAVPSLLCVGVGAMQMMNAHCVEFRIARVSFWLAGLLPASAIQYALIQSDLSTSVHVSLAFGSSVVIGLGAGELLKWVAVREAACKKATGPESPRFETFEPRVEIHEANNTLAFSIGYQNIGKQDALDVDTAIWVSDVSLSRDPVVRTHESSMDVPPNSPRYFEAPFVITKPEIDPVFIVLSISYRETRQQEHRQRQQFFYKWVGIQNKITNTTLQIVSRADRSEIERKMKLATEIGAPVPIPKGLKVSVVNFSLYADATIAVQLIFLNDGPAQRTVLSVALEWRASDQTLEKTRQFRMAFDRVDGDTLAPITLNPNSEAAPKYQGIVPSNLLKEVGATVGLKINASDGKGSCRSTSLKLLTINPAPASGGISYTSKSVVSVLLDESTKQPS